MTGRAARFEVVHTGPRQFHARFRAANGEIVWVTETYKRRRSAWRAVGLLESAVDARVSLELREIDERAEMHRIQWAQS